MPFKLNYGSQNPQEVIQDINEELKKHGSTIRFDVEHTGQFMRCSIREDKELLYYCPYDKTVACTMKAPCFTCGGFKKHNTLVTPSKKEDTVFRKNADGRWDNRGYELSYFTEIEGVCNECEHWKFNSCRINILPKCIAFIIEHCHKYCV